MTQGPFAAEAEMRAWLEAAAQGEDPLFHAILDGDGRAAGVAAYLRIQPEHGVIEVGNIVLAPRLQRTPAATEAMVLMMGRAFDDLGYRRYEWKCDALNIRSRHAAQRLGFTYDGLFRQAVVYKGRNRDTAWYAILDRDWLALKPRFEAWLDPANFDADGNQKTRLDVRNRRW